MRSSKTIISLLAILFFAVTVMGLFTGFPGWVLILLFLFHSVCLLLLAFIFSTERKDEAQEKEMQQELSDLKSQANSERELMKKALDAREGELSERLEELRKLKEESAEKEENLIKLREEFKAAKEELGELKNNTGNEFLPPANDKPVLLDIIKIINECAAEFDKDAKKAGLTIRVSSTEESVFVKAQASRLRIMFRNIIDNSIKYMNRSGSLVITVSKLDDDIFIVLKDTGAGLAEEETKHIFELNFQGSNRISGNGLGLTQAKAIVDYYGGTIYGRSMPDKGMGIYIQLPSSSAVREEA
ncbi:MAG: HAMP domain-containing histidine kinase [Lachnospiraceae bacterium]|nr:HAMP domain-containing histidine kinase [Lachnospiraceae bacterium]